MNDNEALADTLAHCLAKAVMLTNAYAKARNADEQLDAMMLARANAVELIATIDALTGDEPPIVADKPATFNID
jgi:hypothetical protein